MKLILFVYFHKKYFSKKKIIDQLMFYFLVFERKNKFWKKLTLITFHFRVKNNFPVKYFKNKIVNKQLKMTTEIFFYKK